MKAYTLCVLVLGLALHACLSAEAQGTVPAGGGLVTSTVPLPAFTNVSLCLPLNTLIIPGMADQYGVSVTGQPGVVPQVDAQVLNGTLVLGLSGPVSTSQVVEITVTLPAGNLTNVAHTGTGGKVLVAPGFNATNFTAITGKGAGQLYIQGLNATNLDVESIGNGNLVVDGSFENVSVIASGVGNIYIAGVNSSVLVRISGVVNTFIKPALPTVSIGGTVNGIATVAYSSGTCNLGASAFMGGCEAVATIDIPEPDALWSCGLVTDGTFVCSGEDNVTASSSGALASQTCESTELNMLA